MDCRRSFLKELAAIGGGLVSLNPGYDLGQVSDQDSECYDGEFGEDSDEVTDQDRQVLDEFEGVLQDANLLNQDLSSVEHKDDRTVYTLGGNTINHDFYATSFSNFDDQIVNSYNIENELKNIATDIASKGNSLAEDGRLPNDEVTVYTGITGRTNSFLPIELNFRDGETIQPEDEVKYAFEELKDQAEDTTDELVPNQTQALQNLGGFDDAYQNKVVITENLDGVDNENYKPGEFELGDEYAELVNTQINNGIQEAQISTNQESDNLQNKEIGYRFEVGDYELRLLQVDSEAGYIEAEVMEGDYESIENTPFPQVDEPF